MTIFAKSRAAKMALRMAALAGMTAGLSACYTDFGLGYASDGYGYNNYDCDPYSPFDSYYGCDYGYGFSNIGYGGGWYDNFYYPGHGIFVFDNYGRRHNMRDNHRRHWGSQRFNWQREHYRGGRHQNGNQGGHGDHRDGDYRDGRHGDNHDGRRGGRNGDRRGHNGWQGRGNPAGAVGVPPAANPQPGRGEGYGRSGRGEGDRRGGRRFGNQGGDAVGVPQVEGEPRLRDGTISRRQERRSEGVESRRGSYTPPPQQPAPQDYGQPQQSSQPVRERRTARPEARDQRRNRNRDIENQVEQ